ncbi:hypothetical protein D3C87_1580170 [compost metagenome]
MASRSRRASCSRRLSWPAAARPAFWSHRFNSAVRLCLGRGVFPHWTRWRRRHPHEPGQPTQPDPDPGIARAACRRAHRRLHHSCGGSVLHAPAVAIGRRVHQDRKPDAAGRLPQTACRLWPHVRGDVRPGVGQQAVGALEPERARGRGLGQTDRRAVGRGRRELPARGHETPGAEL